MVDETGEAPAAEEEKPEERDEDVRALRAKLGAGVLTARLHRGQLAVEIAPASLAEAASFLRDTRGFGMLSFLAGVDCLELPASHRFKVTYSLLDLDRAKRIRIEVPCEDDLAPSLPSVAGVWPAAVPHECEAYDLVGIVFEGNENPERILTPEGFEGHPHRKDFDISSEPVAFSFRSTPEGKPEAAE
jgi:NADH:ubiquinone oxidoreductase subunit C